MVETSVFQKKIKAKVGKRAPTKANVTDTSFTAVGIHVSKQKSITNNSSTVAIAATAANAAANATPNAAVVLQQQQQIQLQIQEMIYQQWKHPTTPVRLAGLKKFKRLYITIVKEMMKYHHTVSNNAAITTVASSSSSSSSRSNWYNVLYRYNTDILRQLVHMACMDDDRMIRQFAIQLLYDIYIASCCCIDPNVVVVAVDDDPTATALVLPIPYTLYPYMIAIITTSLNSLSIYQQMDGTILVQYIMNHIFYHSSYHGRGGKNGTTNHHLSATNIPSATIHNNNNNNNTAPILDTTIYNTTMKSAIIQCIPPLIRLFKIVPDIYNTTTTTTTVTTPSTSTIAKSKLNTSSSCTTTTAAKTAAAAAAAAAAATTATRSDNTTDDDTDTDKVDDDEHVQQHNNNNNSYDDNDKDNEIDIVDTTTTREHHPMFVMESMMMTKKRRKQQLKNYKKKRQRGQRQQQHQQQQQGQQAPSTATTTTTNKKSSNSQSVASSSSTHSNPKYNVLMAISTIFRNYHSSTDSTTKLPNNNTAFDSCWNNTSMTTATIATATTINASNNHNQIDTNIQQQLSRTSSFLLIPTRTTKRCQQQQLQHPSSSTTSRHWYDHFPSLQQLGIPNSELKQRDPKDSKLETTLGTTMSTNNNSNINDSPTTTTTTTNLLLLTKNELLDLLVYVRDYMIEITMLPAQSTSTNNSSNTFHNNNINWNAIKGYHATTFLTCSIVMRYILEYYNQYYNNNSSIEFDDSNSLSSDINTKRLLKLCQQLGSYIVNVYSVYSNDPKDIALLSHALLALVDTVLPFSKSTSDVINISHSKVGNKQQKRSNPKNTIFDSIQAWIQLIVKHMESNFEDDIEIVALLGSSSSSAAAAAAAVSTTSNAIDEYADLSTTKEMLLIFQQLLLRSELHPYFPQRQRFIELFTSIFCNVIDHPLHQQWLKSDVGRTAVVICCQFISLHQYNIQYMNQFFGTTTVTIRILRSLPYYIVQYQEKHPYETALCYSALHQIVIRMSNLPSSCNNATSNDSEYIALYYNDFIPYLRMQMETITSGTPSNSIFEAYPEQIQRQAICFFIMSGVCSTSMIKNVGSICARCFVKNCCITEQSMTKSDWNVDAISPTMVAFIVQAIHGIRKTLPMAVYVQFLIDSIGIMTLDIPFRVKWSNVFNVSFAFDQGIQTVASCLIASNTTKVLPMLEPLIAMVLRKCIQEQPDQQEVLVSSHEGEIVQARAGLCFLALFSVDIQQQHKLNGIKQNSSVFHYTTSEFEFLVIDCLRYMLSDCADILLAATVRENESSFYRWLSPIIAIFAAEQQILSRILANFIDVVEDFDSTKQDRIMNIWLHILNEPRISSILHIKGKELMADVMSSCKNSSSCDGTEKHGSSVKDRLINEIEIRCHLPKNPKIFLTQ